MYLLLKMVIFHVAMLVSLEGSCPWGNPPRLGWNGVGTPSGGVWNQRRVATARLGTLIAQPPTPTETEVDYRQV